MQASERRRKILEFFEEKETLTYGEILDKISRQGEDPITIFNDLDTLVFFKFLQHKGVRGKSSLELTSKLEIRPDPKTKIKPQTKNNPRILSRLTQLEHEIPPWYRKRVVLTVLDDKHMEFDEIFESVQDQYPHVRWHLPLVKASLKILGESDYVSGKEHKGTEWYTSTPKSKSLLEKPLIQQFDTLKKLKDEFTTEFRAFEILKLVRDHNKAGISSGTIARHFQKKYGMRGNQRRAIKNTLENMATPELLRVSGGSEKRAGHIYHLGKAAEILLSGGPVIVMNNHNIQDFKETVKQFFEKYRIIDLKRDDKSSIEQILDDLEQCAQDLSLRSPEEWATHIVFLADHLRRITPDSWEKRAFQCISACILSRLLPPAVSVNILKDYPPPTTPSREEHHLYIGIASEYYFDLTDAYLKLEENDKAFQSFERLELLCSESFDFLILKGRIKMLKCNMRKINDMREILDIFKEALRLSKGKERVVALFNIGLAQYQRGNFRDLKKLEPKTPEEEQEYKELEKWHESKPFEERWERKGAKEIWELCIEQGCTVSQETVVRHNLANVYRMLGEMEKAKEFYSACIALAGIREKEEFKAKSLIGLANVLIDTCSWDEAEKQLREIIQEYKKVVPVAATASTNLGVLLARKGKVKEALSCHKEALGLENIENYPAEYCTILINMGDVLQKLKNPDEAIDAFEKASTVIGGDTLLGQALEISKAELYIEMGNLDEAWRLAHRVLQERWIGNRRSEAEACRIQGKILLCRNKLHRAKESLEESAEILRELNLKYELIEVYELLEACCKPSGEEKEKYRNARETLIQQMGLSN